MPPEGVRTIQPQLSARPSARARSNASNPLPPEWTSMSTTRTPVLPPVGRPMFASGFRCHQSWTTRADEVASWKPFGVSGCLPPGTQGKTGIPRFA